MQKSSTWFTAIVAALAWSSASIAAKEVKLFNLRASTSGATRRAC